MNKTRIEWSDYTWNPVTGCLHGCEYCYARRVATRFNGCYGETGGRHDLIEPLRDSWKDQETGERVYGPIEPYPYCFDPTLHRYKLGEPAKKAAGVVIFVCSMADLFGEWVPDDWIMEVFAACAAAPQHTYLFLTKNPGRYIKLAESGLLPNSSNMWYGSTITKPTDLFFFSNYRQTFLSIEPILEPFTDFEKRIIETNWAIFGAETGNRKEKVRPTWEWVKDAVSCFGLQHTPVFMKDSMSGIVPPDNFMRQLPDGVTLKTKTESERTTT